MDRLKPCPFCGSDAEMCGSDNLAGKPFWYVSCSECGASVYGADNQDEAAEHWNRREEAHG